MSSAKSRLFCLGLNMLNPYSRCQKLKRIFFFEWGLFWLPYCAPLFIDGISSHVFMMTSSKGNIFRVTGPLCGEFTGPGEFPTQRPVTRSFDVFFDLRLNKRLSKQSWGWWFEMLSCPLWRHCNVKVLIRHIMPISCAYVYVLLYVYFDYVWVRDRETLCPWARARARVRACVCLHACVRVCIYVCVNEWISVFCKLINRDIHLLRVDLTLL